MNDHGKSVRIENADTQPGTIVIEVWIADMTGGADCKIWEEALPYPCNMASLNTYLTPHRYLKIYLK